MKPTVSPLPKPWFNWLRDNLLAGVAETDLIDSLATRSVSESQAKVWIRIVQDSDAFKTLRARTRRMRQSHRYLQLRRHLNALRAAPQGIREHGQLTAQDFFEDYYFENRPVVLRGYARCWPAFSKWTPEFLKREYGHVPIKITDGRNQNPDYDMQHKRHTRECSMAEFVDIVQTDSTGNDTYMVANNRNIENPLFAPILKDVVYDEAMFVPGRWKSCTAFWLGPAGTVTPNHHDTCNILFVQIYGRKRFRLFSPLDLELLNDARSMYAAIDPENPNIERYPNFSDVTEKSVVLEPGDAIFLPIGWWHHVRSLDVSISLAMTNFTVANQFDWFRPGEVP